MKYLRFYFKKYRLESLLAPLFKMLEACFDLAGPIVVARIINIGIAQGDRGYILTRFGILGAMGLLGLLCSFTAQWFSAKAATGTATGLRHRLLEKIQSLSLTELDGMGVPTLITRMTSDINQVQNGMNLFLRLFLRSPFIVLGAMVMAFSIDSTLALIFVAVILVLSLIVGGIMLLSNPRNKEVQRKLDGITAATRESLLGVRVIRAFGREEAETEAFHARNQDLTRAQIAVSRVTALLNPLTYVVINGAIIAILYFGARRVNGGLLLSGDVIALINYISQILVELVKLANLVVSLSKAVASMGRIEEILDTPCSMDFSGSAAGSNPAEAVRFEDVSLRYRDAGADSLSHISFTAMAGETIGVIGGTGSGKSSLVQLIPRFYDAASGTVYIQGDPVKSWDKAALQRTVALVDQKARLFKGTIRSNLLWGKKDATEAELWAALETAQAADFVRAKPLGLEEPVEQGGNNLSGGQKQRLTIARALLAGADILILDDSASALDYATDAALRHALRAMPGKRTLFIVSQRTGSIAHADKILVLEEGQLVGCGTHESLLADCPVYKEIYDSQFKKSADIPVEKEA